MKTFTYILKIEIPSEKAMEMEDEWLLSGLTLHPAICTTVDFFKQSDMILPYE